MMVWLVGRRASSPRGAYRSDGLLVLLFSLLIVIQLVSKSSASSASSGAAVADVAVTTTADAGGGSAGNPIVQLAGFVKDTVVRTVNGSREMWTNHGKCNEIRSKQKEYRTMLKEKWELEEKGLSRKDLQQRLKQVNGGISYDEYIFLTKGKEDRGKLMNLAFLMFGAPRFLPYAIMFYPDMMPSPLQSLPNSHGERETKLEKLSRQRCHAVMSTLLQLERDAKLIPAISKLNIFGRKSQQLQLDKMNNFNQYMAKLFASTASSTPDSASNEGVGAQVILNALDDQLYTKSTATADSTRGGGGASDDDDTEDAAGTAATVETFTRGEQRLVNVPKPVVRGLIQAIEGPSILSNFQPHFMTRGKIIAHCQKVADADLFLVQENVDLTKLSSTRLKEACNDRLIGCPKSTDDELRTSLQEWLTACVTTPTARIAKNPNVTFNSNLARASLLSYYALESTRDTRSSSYLPRILFQSGGQNQQKQHSNSHPGDAADGDAGKKKRRR